MKPKIALIVDTDNWAFYNRANLIKERLSEYFDFKIIPIVAIDQNILQVILMIQDCDLVHFFWRGFLFSLDNENYFFKRNQIDVNKFIEEKFSKIVKTTCIPDHALLDLENIDKTKKVLNFVDDYYVLSRKLLNIYNKLDCRKPSTEIMGGINTDLFKPNDLERFNLKNLEERKIIIGWAGNSKWGDWNGTSGTDVKGVDTILIPAINELKKEGYNVELNLADRNVKHIPIEQMSNFYNKIDVYVCVSKEEGGPNTILESMSCGIPIISTNVGFVEEVLGEKQSRFIINERNIENLKIKLKNLLDNKKQFKELSEENLKQIKKFDYDVMMKKFKHFFEKNLKKSNLMDNDFRS